MIKKYFSVFLVLILLAGAVQGLAKEWPGSGVICAGDLWESFMPSAFGKYYGENNADWARAAHLVRVGNYDRAWSTPTQSYPGGDIWTMTWNQSIYMVEYDPTGGFTAREEIDSNEKAKYYSYAAWQPAMATAGGEMTNGDNYGGVPWVDAARTHQMYDATFPTNLGLTVRMRAHGLSMNEANMNDFVLVEFQVTNTGTQDYNMDGVVDRTNHKVEALSLSWEDGTFGSMRISTRGGRWSWGSWPKMTVGGYDATPDPDGNPWAMPVVYCSNVDQGNVDANGWAPDGAREVGYRSSYKFFYDIWVGTQFIAVKEGPLTGGAAAADKKTIYDSHPIGEGVQRGWFASHGRLKVGGPYGRFFNATGTFYEDGGKGELSALPSPIQPDPNWFDTTQAYTADDPVSFAAIVKPEADRGQPMGDIKLTGFWLQNWERNFPGTPAPGIPAEDEMTVGCTQKTKYNFGSNHIAGVGPFSLEVGETITIVCAEYAGYRNKGARNALKAARYAYENDFNVPTPPTMPNMMVKAVPDAEVQARPAIYWDNAAEGDADFAGYKVYKVSAFPTYESSKLGVRFLDNYHHQTAADIGATDDELEAAYCEPFNPNRSVPADYLREWNPKSHGPWKIVAYITPDQLADYANEDGNGYAYKMVDMADDVSFGYTYWYYVAAFDNETGEMAGVTFDGLESGRANWNGRTGRWQGDYPFATASSTFPIGPEQRAEIGAPFVNLPSRLDAQTLIDGDAKIEVRPNPYKVQAPHDVGTEHKIMFYNLTMNTKITILDLSGQIMDVLEYEGYNSADGTIFWDMFTKDGPEVQSGLYIWIAEYPGGQQTGYLAIMR